VASDARAGLASDPDGYFCAVEEGRIRGMVSALVRGLVWFLSMFFVLPGDQGSVVNFNALAPPRLRPRPQAITPPAPHTGAPLEPQAQRQRNGKSLGARWPVHYFAGSNSTTGIVRCVRS
jgi:hypothetical protein